MLSKTMWTSSTLPALCPSTFCSWRTEIWRRGSSWPPGRTFQRRVKNSLTIQPSLSMLVSCLFYI
ncbi:unnamed protein product [Dibothriocephalus latus]|uniref:Uncharacterized protein n=1 Tax=Dibothriocephalus latus TaxID=60516 RepID=A0A3P7Q314_DIBLA|nr:unnamed protein product [Dibothriocephalus latus]